MKPIWEVKGEIKSFLILGFDGLNSRHLLVIETEMSKDNCMCETQIRKTSGLEM